MLAKIHASLDKLHAVSRLYRLACADRWVSLEHTAAVDLEKRSRLLVAAFWRIVSLWLVEYVLIIKFAAMWTIDIKHNLTPSRVMRLRRGAVGFKQALLDLPQFALSIEIFFQRLLNR